MIKIQLLAIETNEKVYYECIGKSRKKNLAQFMFNKVMEQNLSKLENQDSMLVG